MIKTKIEIVRTLPDGTTRVIASMEQQDSLPTKYEARITAAEALSGTHYGRKYPGEDT